MPLIETNKAFSSAAKAAPGYVEHAFANTWDIEPGDNTALAELQRVHKAARDGWQQIHRTNANLMKSPNGRDKPLETLQRSASFAQTRIHAVQKAAALAVEQAQTNLALVNGQLGKVVSPPELSSTDVAVMGEIRAYLKGLKTPEEREAFINKAFQSGDARTIRAVIGAPAYLTGIIDLTHERWREQFLQVAAPGLVTARDNLNRGIELAKGAAQSIEAHAKEIIDFRKAADLNALSKELEGVGA